MNSDILNCIMPLGIPYSYGDYSGVDDFFSEYPDGAYIVRNGYAQVGWDACKVMFGGRRARANADKFVVGIEKKMTVRGLRRTTNDGIVDVSFHFRKKTAVSAIMKSGGNINFWGLKLTMPNGGTVQLRKFGEPNAVSLEISTDGVNWQEWTPVLDDYSYMLSAGQTLCIRNTSSTFVPLSTSNSDYWRFVFDNTVKASGSVMSMSCNDETITEIGGNGYNFVFLFYNATTLTTAPELPATILTKYCYSAIFYGCTALKTTPILPAEIIPEGSYSYMFGSCGHVNNIKTSMTDISAVNCLTNWVDGVAVDGDFHCLSSLVIPIGVDGIPNGWTRHNL